jgi:hypothetical protein
LLKEQRSSSIQYFELDYLDARISALRGDEERALDALSDAIDTGWREWWTEYDPLLEGIRSEAGYRSAVDFIATDLKRQKAEAEKLFRGS